MSWFDWRIFLEGFGRELLEDEDIRVEVPDAIVETGWLGYEGAGEAAILALEGRIGKPLPPSYREFLAATNGWRVIGWNLAELLGTEDVRWLREIDPKLIEIWTSSTGSKFSVPDEVYLKYGQDQLPHLIRDEYLGDMLAISTKAPFWTDYLLLNPRIVFEDGEWEAWDFSTEHPGAYRSRSFREMMQRIREMHQLNLRHG